MSFNYDTFKQTFVEYFSSKGYKTLVSNRDPNLIFMYSFKEDISVVELFNRNEQTPSNQKDLNRLIKKLAKIKEVPVTDIKVIKLFFDEKTKGIEEQDKNNYLVAANTLDFFKNKLVNNFNDAEKIQAVTEGVDIKTSQQETKKDLDDLSDVQNQEQLQQKVNQLGAMIKSGKAIGPLVFMILFMILPIVGSIIQLVWGSDGFGPQAARLFQGGTTYNLTIQGHEVWRILTWGFAATSDNFLVAVLIIILSGWSAYNMMKLGAFNMQGWKFGLTFVSAYLITGFFGSVMFPTYAFGGVMPILGLATGILALATSARGTLVASVSKIKLIWPIVLMIIFPIFTGGGMEYASEVSAFAIGGSVAYLTRFNKENVDWTIVLPIIVLLVAVLLPIIMLVIPFNAWGYNDDVLYTLEMYVKKGIMSEKHANSIITNIGWNDIRINVNSANGEVTIVKVLGV